MLIFVDCAAILDGAPDAAKMQRFSSATSACHFAASRTKTDRRFFEDAIARRRRPARPPRAVPRLQPTMPADFFQIIRQRQA